MMWLVRLCRYISNILRIDSLGHTDDGDGKKKTLRTCTNSATAHARTPRVLKYDQRLFDKDGSV